MALDLTCWTGGSGSSSLNTGISGLKLRVRKQPQSAAHTVSAGDAKHQRAWTRDRVPVHEGNCVPTEDHTLAHSICLSWDRYTLAGQGKGL